MTHTQILTLPAVGLLGVTKVYATGKNQVDALRGVSVTFDRGTFTAVMGPSGSGKSTLLQCAAGLDRPTGGTVTVGGTDLGHLDEAALSRLRRDRIGFVFQEFNLLQSLTAAQNVALPLRLAGRRAVSRRPGVELLGDRVLAELARVGLADRAGHRPAQLSGGQQQRVAIARALVTAPDVVFADEPTGALDSRTGREILDLLRDLVDGTGQTVVMVTHDPRAAARADRVVFLADGRLVGEEDRPTAETVATRITVLEDGR
ncbi:MAG TPA: ABC transporter ATP-binding protein [Kineosporiaceae bacterium]|nr:ABC transporter ATP-binding protein [Kineosporiaceae bacterium]